MIQAPKGIVAAEDRDLKKRQERRTAYYNKSKFRKDSKINQLRSLERELERDHC